MFLSLQCIFIDFFENIKYFNLVFFLCPKRFEMFQQCQFRLNDNLVFCLKLLNRHPKQKLNRMFLLETHKFLYNKQNYNEV